MILILLCMAMAFLPILLFVLGVRLKRIFYMEMILLACVIFLAIFGIIFNINYMK